MTVHLGATWHIRLNDPCSAEMRAVSIPCYCKLYVERRLSTRSSTGCRQEIHVMLPGLSNRSRTSRTVGSLCVPLCLDNNYLWITMTWILGMLVHLVPIGHDGRSRSAAKSHRPLSGTHFTAFWRYKRLSWLGGWLRYRGGMPAKYGLPSQY